MVGDRGRDRGNFGRDGGKMTDNRCARCEKTFDCWSRYHDHAARGLCVLKIIPIRTTARTKTEIVRNFETKIKDFLVT